MLGVGGVLVLSGAWEEALGCELVNYWQSQHLNVNLHHSLAYVMVMDLDLGLLMAHVLEDLEILMVLL
jgi:hypothetical protein